MSGQLSDRAALNLSSRVFNAKLPGLGVALDREAVAHYHDVFKRQGKANMFAPALQVHSRR